MECFSDFAVYLIRKKDILVFQNSIINHFYDALKHFKETEQFPSMQSLFTISSKITKELSNYKQNDYEQFKLFTAENLWLFDIKSRIDFNRLWELLSIAVENNEDEMIFVYWKQAFNFIQYDLRLPDSIYDSTLSVETINQKEINSVKAKQEEFIEFHYYLGSLLLYKNRIECIRRIWSYTTSQPPNYPLLPIRLDEIISEYFKACNNLDKDRWEKSLRFKFPKVDSIQSDSIIDSWYRKYFLLLFLRQYTLYYNINYIDPLQRPTPPPEKKDLQYHLDKIDTLEKELTRLLDPIENKELLEGLKLSFITTDWCNKNKKTYPTKIISEYRTELDTKLGEIKKSEELLPVRIKQFYSKSRSILEKVLNEYFGEGMDIFVNVSTNECKRKLAIKSNKLFELGILTIQ